MKLKRYNAPDIRQAINKVRDELGPDAVIISNRSTGNGVEIIAAIDYDESIFASPNSDAMIERELARSETREPELNTYSKAPLATTKPLDGFATPDDERYSFSQQARKKQRSETKQRNKNVEQSGQVSQEWLEKFKTSVEERFGDETEKEQPVKARGGSSECSDSRSAESSQDVGKIWSELQDIKGLLQNQLSSLAWNDLNKRFPKKAKLLRHLYDLGLGPATARRLAEGLSYDGEFDEIWRTAIKTLAVKIPVVDDDIVQDGGVFALVGPTGVGKTTTIAKLAARYALSHGTKGIALITTDNYRVGAQEQLRTFGRILGTPVRIASDVQELKKTLKSLYDKQLILIDTAGMSQRDLRLTEQFAMLNEGSSSIKTMLVVPAATQLQVLDEVVSSFSKAILEGCIITKIDESASIGGVLSTMMHHQLPISYISDGQRVPEDLHRARAIDLVKRAVSLLKQKSHRADEDMLEMAFGEIVANELA
ncbi:MAG: flagellar biosynthesis protein FlhF [Gammaproteobacteria bacterium]|nr:flagellar biosynthesis protein FlhF [Gammaproteobacteria bacterium]